MKLYLTLALLCAFAFPAQADSVFTVTGSTTLTGNDVCGGPCVETINFTFSVANVKLSPHTYLLEVLPGWTLTSTGPLLPFTSVGTGTAYFGIGNLHDEIDFDSISLLGFNSQPVKPDLADAYLYGCGTPVCINDFSYDGMTSGIFRGASLNYKVTGGGSEKHWDKNYSDPVSTPEPRTADLVAVGVLACVLCRAERKRGSK